MLVSTFFIETPTEFQPSCESVGAQPINRFRSGQVIFQAIFDQNMSFIARWVLGTNRATDDSKRFTRHRSEFQGVNHSYDDNKHGNIKTDESFTNKTCIPRSPPVISLTAGEPGIRPERTRAGSYQPRPTRRKYLGAPRHIASQGRARTVTCKTGCLNGVEREPAATESSKLRASQSLRVS
jgi:hypothetical protein